MTQNSFKVAITGGIGSGKSCLSQIIKGRGYPVFSCDEIYSDLLGGEGLIDKICKIFGDVKLPDGSLDRKKLSSIVFSDEGKKKQLEKLTHGAIMERALSKMEGHKLSFLEVPLLFENGYEKYFDGVIVVLRDLSKRIEALVKRDNTDEKSVINRIKSQIDYEKLDFANYYVTHNDYNLNFLEDCADTTLFLLNLKIN